MRSKEVEYARNDARLIKEFVKGVKSKPDSSRILELKKTNKILKSFVVEKRSGGQKLTQLAALLLITPDPVTDAAALPVLLAAGIAKMRSKKQNDIQRIVEGAGSSLTSLFSSADLSSL